MDTNETDTIVPENSDAQFLAKIVVTQLAYAAATVAVIEGARYGTAALITKMRLRKARKLAEQQ